MSNSRQYTKFQITFNDVKEGFNIASFYDPVRMDYCIACHEFAPSTGHEHFHMFVIYKSLRRLSAVIKDFKPHHVEACKGNVFQNIAYIEKEGDVVLEKGDRPEERVRTKDNDLKFKELVEQAKIGQLDRECIMYARYRSYFDQLDMMHCIRMKWNGTLEYKNLWIYGPAGSGKSSLVQNYIESANCSCYLKTLNKWWDGFFKQDLVLIEDADPIYCKKLAHHFKIWADRFSFAAEVKNGYIIIFPSYYFIITSNYSIEECFEPEDREAIIRRFDILYLK